MTAAPPMTRDKRFGIERCRHQQQSEIRTETCRQIQCECEPQVRLQASFVKLVEYQQPDPFERGIRLDSSRQDALGDHLDTAEGADPALEPDLIADAPAERLAEKCRHARCDHAGRRPAGLEDQDPAGSEPVFVEQGERDPGRFPRAGGRLQYGMTSPKRGAQVVQDDLDRQCLTVWIRRVTGVRVHSLRG
jgi:hypothetical protein